MAEHELLTIEEVADYLRVSERTVYDWAHKGEIPCGKLGTTWRFKRMEVERWVDERLSKRPQNTASQSINIDDVLVPERIAYRDLLQDITHLVVARHGLLRDRVQGRRIGGRKSAPQPERHEVRDEGANEAVLFLKNQLLEFGEGAEFLPAEQRPAGDVRSGFRHRARILRRKGSRRGREVLPQELDQRLQMDPALGVCRAVRCPVQSRLAPAGSNAWTSELVGSCNSGICTRTRTPPPGRCSIVR